MQITTPAGKLVGVAVIVFLVGNLVGFGDLAVIVSILLLVAALITWVLTAKPDETS